jgi:hypothetical protein
MGVLQTTYVERISSAVAGMVADMTISNIDTRSVETVAGIGFGLACGKGVDDRGVVLGATLTTDFVGVSVRDTTLPPIVGATVDVYPRYASAGILTEGDIWVIAAANVVDGDDVTYNNVTGAFSSIAAGAGQFLVIGARWMTTAISPALAIIRLTGPLGAV